MRSCNTHAKYLKLVFRHRTLCRGGFGSATRVAGCDLEGLVRCHLDGLNIANHGSELALQSGVKTTRNAMSIQAGAVLPLVPRVDVLENCSQYILA